MGKSDVTDDGHRWSVSKKENRSNSPVDPRRRHTSGRHGELSFEIPSHCAEVHTRLRNPSQKQGEMAEETVSRRPEITFVSDCTRNTLQP